MRWIGDPAVIDGVEERAFDVAGPDGRRVPGVRWRATAAPGDEPIVLLGHGGTHHKRHPFVVERAGGMVRDHGVTVVAIDGPVHGDRRMAGVGLEDRDEMWASYRAYLASRPTGDLADDVVADWRATLDAIADDGWSTGPVGYWGLSMGSRFGVPLVAAEPRIAAAVLGLAGTTAGPYMATAAARITVPVLFVANWDDELFPRDGAIELFGLLASADKRMHLFPGGHGDLPDDEHVELMTFLVDRLAKSCARR